MSSKKPTLKHMQPNGEIATRQSARAYTHVLMRKINRAARIAAVEASRASRLADAEKYARRAFKQNAVEIATGIGGQVPYWPGQGGYRKFADGTFATHEQPDYQFKSAVEYMQKHGGTVEGYIADAIADTERAIAREIEGIATYSEEWYVMSWHSRANLAKPDYIGAGDMFQVEAINGGVRS